MNFPERTAHFTLDGGRCGFGPAATDARDVFNLDRVLPWVNARRCGGLPERERSPRAPLELLRSLEERNGLVALREKAEGAGHACV